MWLTSTERWLWDRLHRVELLAVSPAAEAEVEDAWFRVADDQPDGGMRLLLRRRDGRRWSAPLLGRPDDAWLWQLAPEAVPPPAGEAVRAPGPVAQAWCRTTSTEAEARALQPGGGASA